MNAVWSLPPPLDVIAVAVIRFVIAVFELLVVRPTRNTLTWGIGWTVVYWLAVWGSWSLGRWGSSAVRQVRRGNDVFEFAPGRSAWVGAVVQLIRLQVAGEAWVAGSALVVGYGLFLALVFVGVAWEWLFPIFGFWLLRRALQARARRRGPWWQQRTTVLDS